MGGLLEITTDTRKGNAVATQRLVTLVDDTDGSEAVETVRFMLDHTDYEIDLNELNASLLRKGLAGFVAKARKLPAATKNSKRIRTASSRTLAIREWANANGIKVNDRGRIPAEVTAKWELETLAAQSPPERPGSGATQPADASPERPAEPATGAATVNPADRSRAIREWAKHEGIKVNDRGRIPANVVAEYEARNAGGM